MSYLETKRNTLMNSIASGPTNLFEGLTWKKRTYNEDGYTIGTKTANGRCHEEEFITMKVGETYYVRIIRPNNTVWHDCELYDSDKNYMGRLNWNYASVARGTTFTATQPFLRYSGQLGIPTASLKLCKDGEQDDIEYVYINPDDVPD